MALAQIALPRDADPSQRAALLGKILDEINALFGVEAVAINDFFIGNNPVQVVTAERGPKTTVPQRLNLSVDAITPGYFEMVGTRVLQGRELASTDSGTPSAVVINQRLADVLWPHQKVLGERIRFGRTSEAPWLTVVGIVADSRRQGLDTEPIPQAFLPHQQAPARLMNLIVRSSVELDQLASLIRQRVDGVSSRIPVYRVRRLADDVNRGQEMRRFAAATLLSFFAASSLALAGLGLYATLSLRLASQLREIGIRKALGANRRHIIEALIQKKPWAGWRPVEQSECWLVFGWDNSSRICSSR